MSCAHAKSQFLSPVCSGSRLVPCILLGLARSWSVAVPVASVPSLSTGFSLTKATHPKAAGDACCNNTAVSNPGESTNENLDFLINAPPPLDISLRTSASLAVVPLSVSSFLSCCALWTGSYLHSLSNRLRRWPTITFFYLSYHANRRHYVLRRLHLSWAHLRIPHR